MTERRSLCPVSRVVNTNEAQGTSHSHDDADVGQRSLECFGALECAMDKFAVHTNRVAKQERSVGQQQKHRDRGRCCGERGTDDKAEKARIDPQRLQRRPDDCAVDRIRVRAVNAKDRGTHWRTLEVAWGCRPEVDRSRSFALGSACCQPPCLPRMRIATSGVRLNSRVPILYPAIPA